MNATTCNYSSFVLLATAPHAVPNHTVPDRFGGWSLINSPIFPLLCPPSSPAARHPCPAWRRGFQGLGRTHAAWESPGAVGSPQGGTGPAGIEQRRHWAVLAGPRAPCTAQGTCRATPGTAPTGRPMGASAVGEEKKNQTHTKMCLT